MQQGNRVAEEPWVVRGRVIRFIDPGSPDPDAAAGADELRGGHAPAARPRRRGLGRYLRERAA